ncbi:Nucleotide-binding universal stress protein, UspA family [Amycolatopsis arida]|uniref:Nucleotide-binding universal stress protein, UspA family n=1 Tax=Amycolatopsis arida TaxID=587909 RepID=A0A1I5YEC0_9PSEU|nr:nucleotide-binding universal stress UspA family protein [Amycolatopsis arida]SFQ42546.1 Nucleotide-binding universal stress protein, UspA family [Amycolatopsis arida]
MVVGVDGSERALDAVRWAAREADRLHAPLLAVNASGYPDLYVGATVPPPDGLREQMQEQGWEFLREAERVAAETAGVRAELRLSVDSSVPFLIEASTSARMLVLGSSGRGGFVGLLVGSTTIALTAHAHCPVVSVRGEERPGAPVVVGVDGSPLSDDAVGHAFAEAAARETELVAVHTWSDADTEVVFSAARMDLDWEPMEESERRVLAERLAGWRERYPEVSVRRVVERDRPRDQLIEWSQRACLVVVGSRGRGGFRGLLLGSTSQALVHHAECPVMVVRPQRD